MYTHMYIIIYVIINHIIETQKTIYKYMPKSDHKGPFRLYGIYNKLMNIYEFMIT